MYIKIKNSEYWVEDEGQGPPVLFLHGFTGTSATWSEVLPFLKLDFRLLRIDLPGHGQTKVPGSLNMQRFCQELSLLLDQLEIKSVFLIGYSLGGRTALSFANYFPDKVRALILESASPGLEKRAEREKRRLSDQKLADQIVRNGIKDFVEKWEKLPLFHTQKLLSAEKQQKIREERLSQTKEGLVSSLTGMGTGAQPSWWDCLEMLNMPVLLLAGEEDDKFMAINNQMFVRLPEAEFYVFPKSGHSLHVEQPENFGTIVYGFLSKHM